jgi:hypothetical protein
LILYFLNIKLKESEILLREKSDRLIELSVKCEEANKELEEKNKQYEYVKKLLNETENKCNAYAKSFEGNKNV